MFELRGIETGYDGTVVLSDVDLMVPPGAVVALLGPNGAGKTTLLRVASGLLPALKGQVLVEGDDVTGRPTHEFARRGICHIPEGRAIFTTMTVRENLALQSSRGEEEQGLARAVEAFPVLGERLDQVAGTLSGGEQQMLALARAYLSNSRFVFLDEVSLGLAPRIVEEIFAFLQRLAREGASLLVVEQYVAQALGLADYVYLLQRGQIVFAGEPGELDGDDLFKTYVGA